jgi:hypothetical protein
MRFWIFLTASLLSSFGFYLNVGEIVVLLIESWWVGLLALLSSIYAWTVYIAMGAAWIARETIPRMWTITGTLAALLALNGGGSAFVLGKRYSPVIMLLHAAPVMPAIFMATWMTIFQLRSTKAHTPTTQTPSTPNSH